MYRRLLDRINDGTPERIAIALLYALPSHIYSFSPALRAEKKKGENSRAEFGFGREEIEAASLGVDLTARAEGAEKRHQSSGKFPTIGRFSAQKVAMEALAEKDMVPITLTINSVSNLVSPHSTAIGRSDVI